MYACFYATYVQQCGPNLYIAGTQILGSIWTYEKIVRAILMNVGQSGQKNLKSNHRRRIIDM